MFDFASCAGRWRALPVEGRAQPGRDASWQQHLDYKKDSCVSVHMIIIMGAGALMKIAINIIAESRRTFGRRACVSALSTTTCDAAGSGTSDAHPTRDTTDHTRLGAAERRRAIRLRSGAAREDMGSTST